MGRQIQTQIVGLLRASHFGPTVLVVSLAFALSVPKFSIQDAAEIALAIFFGQLCVGWTNDLVDFPGDQTALRTEKPLVVGTISMEMLRVGIPIALALAAILSFFGPLGLSGGAIHLLGLLSATAYNLRLKSTVFSAIPYIVSFGALPWAIYVAAGSTPPAWLVIALVLFTCAFHFFNVLKDLESDRSLQIMSLPQVLGRGKSISFGGFLIVLGILDLVITAL